MTCRRSRGRAGRGATSPTAHRTAAAIRAGTIWVNMLPILDVAAPWGGFKTSGWGREFSHQALDAFTETKTVFIGLG